ncbi:alanine racemase [Lachnospiraceae bacterium 50-23]
MKYKFFSHNPSNDTVTYDVINALDKKYTVPLYIYKGKDACENAIEIQRYLGEAVQLCYAVKANCYLVGSLTDVVGNFEVSSEGELEYCLCNQITAEKLSYSGVWKSAQEISRALGAGVKRFILDSINQIEMLQELAREKVEAFLRLSSGNQFGMDISEIIWIALQRERYSNINILGIHYYAGTQRQFFRQMERDFQILKKGLEYLEEKEIWFSEIQLGGGLGVPLYQNDSIQKYEKMADYLFDFIRELSSHYQVTYECGRAIASNAGQYITKVFEKKHRGTSEILLVQGGSHHLKYHGNIMGQKQPFIDCVTRGKHRRKQDYMVCGSLCSSGDILAMRFTDFCVEIGDYMIFYHVGAYSLQEAASLFLTMAMPALLVYNENINVAKALELGWTCHER